MRTLAIPMACCVLLAWPVDSPKAAQVVPTYELYSWEHPEGSWNFCLLYTTDRQKTPEEVLSEKTALHGTEELKKAISKLPKGSRLVWFDRLTLKGVRIKVSEPAGWPGL